MRDFTVLKKITTYNPLKLLILPLVILLGTLELSAQFYPSAYGNIYDKNRNKRDFIDSLSTRDYNRYDFEEYLKMRGGEDPELEAMKDSTRRMVEKLLTAPDELRKIGVSDSLIDKIKELNALEDTLVTIEESLLKRRMNRDSLKRKDSLSLNDVKEMIKKRRQDIYTKAFKLPEAFVYGQEYFRKSIVELSKESEKRYRPPDNYTLNVGDELNITLWGFTEKSDQFRIDNSGSINPEVVGKIYLQGMTYEKAVKVIRDRYDGVYDLKKTNIEITMAYSKSVTVNIVGEVFNPGTYTFSSINSAFNALIAMDGPNQLGSVRNIFIKRNGKTIKNLDVYEYLNNPDSEMDFFLQDNDYIVVPSLENVVHIKGEVKRPYNYEMKEGEGLRELVKYAGNLKPGAYVKAINIKRFENSREVLIDVNLDSLITFNKNFPLHDGDSVFVYKIPQSLHDFVEVIGAVRVPGKYQLTKGDRIADMLHKVEGPNNLADLDKAYVIRLNEKLEKEIIAFDIKDVLLNYNSIDNIPLKGLDTIQVISLNDSRQKYVIYIAGEVNKPGEVEYAEGMTLGDLLKMSGGLKRESANSRLEVSRMILGNRDDDMAFVSGERILMKRVDIAPDLQIPQDAIDYKLKPYDQVFVRISPDFEQQQQIVIYGEINYPGEYTLTSKGENVISLIERAGGFTNYAFKAGARLYRNADSLGYVLLDLEDAISNPRRTNYNYILSDGDSIIVPKLRDYVTLRGAIRHFEVDSLTQFSVPFEGRKSAKWYVKKYGAGFGKDSKKFRTYVQQANGRVYKTQKRIFFINKYPKVESGATVFVDQSDRKKTEKDRRKRRENRNWNDAFDSLTSKIATVLSIFVLVQQAKN